MYHVAYAILLVGLGAGLLTGRRWGYRLVLGGTVVYTLDKLLCLLDRETMEVLVMKQLQPYRDILGKAGTDSLVDMMTLSTVLFVACWWVFAFYIYLRRGYFRA